MTAKPLRWHTLATLATSPLMCHWRSDHPRPDTDALEVGRLIHCATLEPNRWDREFIAEPDFGDGRTKAAKDARAAFLAELAEGVTPVKADDYDLVTRCAAAVRSHPAALPFLSGLAEHEIAWEAHGVACAGRPDLISDRACIVDLKSTRHVSLSAIGRDFASRLYHGQVAWYHDGAIRAGALRRDAENPHVIAVQTVEPFDVVMFRVPDDTLEAGRRLYIRLMETWVGCQQSGWWPGIAPGIVEWLLPPWADGATVAPVEEWV
jgi:exodeoxyribonuclease VIII